ncbi:M48 family metallopeptidase [Amycolatopsis sp. NPDC051903]|uniref:M48 family metallopeptidase n=1 Tax=Amycolatopsis sp. NPDC051903 TaxID=3363936 RepID=UPI0037B726DC
MKNSARALLAVGLPAGFPVLVLALVAAIVVVEVIAFRSRLSHGLEFAVFAAPAAFVLLRALLTFGRLRDDEGVPVTAEAQPELWALVHELAEAVGTAPPDEVRVVARVNAGVLERTRWFGLRVAGRRLAIGAPLFAGLRVDEFRAVLGHELAHYSNRDTRFAVATYRGRVVIMRVLSGLDGASWFGRLAHPLFQAYGWLYFSVSARISRAQELAADAASARVGGTAAATGALRQIAALSAGWRSFVADYLMLGWGAGYLPEHPAEGYRLLLADESRARELAELRRNPRERETSPFDSHPATPDRIRLLEAAPVVLTADGGDRPATELLRDADAVLDAAWLSLLPDEALAKERTDWQTLAEVSMRHDFNETAAKIARGRSMGELLDALDAGRPEDLADPDLRVPADADPAARREPLRESARTRLSIVVLAHLATEGRAQWRISWSKSTELLLTPRYTDELFPALKAAAAGETTSLRALLPETSGVPSGGDDCGDPAPPHARAARE